MAEEVNRAEFEKNLMELSTHGVSKDDIERLRQKFESQFMTPEDIKRQEKNELHVLRRIGGHYGRKSKTRIKR